MQIRIYAKCIPIIGVTAAAAFHYARINDGTHRHRLVIHKDQPAPISLPVFVLTSTYSFSLPFLWLFVPFTIGLPIFFGILVSKISRWYPLYRVSQEPLFHGKSNLSALYIQFTNIDNGTKRK